METNSKIGELLLNAGVISKRQLQKALDKQKETGKKIGETLIDLGYVDEAQFLSFFSQQLNMPVINLSTYHLDVEFSQQLPEAQARLFHTILLGEEDGRYIVGMVDPQDIFALDELSRIFHKTLKIVLVSPQQLTRALDLIYRRTEEIHGFAAQLAEELKPQVEEGGALDKESDTAVASLIISLFEDAVQVEASDIHIEPDENILRIRMRVDGQLQEQIIKNKNIAPALSRRVKLMAGLNIAETRMPQDGRFNINVHNMPIDVRLSTMPTQYGESVVMRLLNQATGVLDLDVIGMSADMLKTLRKLINRPRGIILVTGPTGSGKTTTLYAALNEMNDVSKKIITIEDPVEYRLARINQIQVNSKLDLTFARVLRSTLRQDPDIILVGEIRDRETAQIALRAALTGHLVLATLHTNDAASTAMRLIDMGIEGYLVAATVVAALAQRLVRKICTSCREPYEPTADERTFFSEFYGDDFLQQKFFHGKGCQHCSHTGYQGRIGAFELLEFSSEMKDALRLNDANEFVHLVEKDKHSRSLMASAYSLACQGVTTLSEVLRVAGEED